VLAYLEFDAGLRAQVNRAGQSAVDGMNPGLGLPGARSDVCAHLVKTNLQSKKVASF
jgi:hypothetical protein